VVQQRRLPDRRDIGIFTGNSICDGISSPLADIPSGGGGRGVGGGLSVHVCDTIDVEVQRMWEARAKRRSVRLELERMLACLTSSIFISRPLRATYFSYQLP